MDDAEQKQGERRVRVLLIEHLLGLGLGRPRGFTKQADFEAMVDRVLCPRLAYMTELNLSALATEIAAQPAGKARDQMPIPAHILERAAVIQPPGDEASPLIRAVFAAALGADALEQGWAPELLRALKKDRRWPRAERVQQVKREAGEMMAKADDIRARLADGSGVHDHEKAFLAARDAAAVKCRRIHDLARQGDAV